MCGSNDVSLGKKVAFLLHSDSEVPGITGVSQNSGHYCVDRSILRVYGALNRHIAI